MKLKNKHIASLLFVLVILASSMDYQDEKANEDYYCDMVKDGTWPAFKENVNCKED